MIRIDESRQTGDVAVGIDARGAGFGQALQRQAGLQGRLADNGETPDKRDRGSISPRKYAELAPPAPAELPKSDAGSPVARPIFDKPLPRIQPEKIVPTSIDPPKYNYSGPTSFFQKPVETAPSVDQPAGRATFDQPRLVGSRVQWFQDVSTRLQSLFSRNY